MNGIRTRRTTAVAVGAVLLAALATALPAGAADGRQSPDPGLLPAEVATAADAFAFDDGTGVACDGTGADGWRANTFIVNNGVNIATLDFSVTGLPAGWVGADFDASDGSVAAPLLKGSSAGVNILPANSPAGQINPSALAGFTFASTSWSLADGTYQIGFVCVDASVTVRQWWSLTVIIDADATPNAFMRTSSGPTTTTTTAPGQTTTTTTTTPGQTTTTTTPGQTTTTTTPGDTTTTTTPDSTTTTTLVGALTTDTTTDPFVTGSDTPGGTGGSSSLPTTGIELWHALVGLALIYLGRVLYLLSRSRRSSTSS
jgi:hypothetical protein